MMNELEVALFKLDINYSTETIEKIKLYVEKIIFFNKRFNLVSHNDSNFSTILNSHVIDSLEGIPLINEFNPSKVLDVGSGAGFPGVVMAIFDPLRNYYLLERGEKRSTFLNMMRAELGLFNVKVLNKEIERESSKYDFITIRAFRDLATYSKILKSRLKTNGLIMAYKGKLDNINKEIEKITNIFSKIEVRHARLAENKERNLVLLKLN